MKSWSSPPVLRHLLPLALIASLCGLPATGRGQDLLQDPESAIPVVRPVAERGSVPAQYILGVLLMESRTEASKAEAVRWFEMAANRGLARAQYALGDIYYRGTAVIENFPEALKWFRQAARQEFARAEVALGIIYREGKVTPKDLGQAVYWFTQAARKGEADAQTALGDFYAAGIGGVAQDEVEAYRWFLLAAAQGNQTAIDRRDDLRERMTRDQIMEAQRRANAAQFVAVRRNPRVEQQEREIRDMLAGFEREISGAPAEQQSGVVTY